MEILKPELSRIADALESIAKCLQGDNGLSKVITEAPKDNELSIINNIACHTPCTLEEELFLKTVVIYHQEAKRKDVENLKRKSGVKVSKELIIMQMYFIH